MIQLAWLACEILEFSCLCLAMFGINNMHPCPAFSMGGAGDWDSVPMFVNKPSYSVIIFESFLFCQNDFKIISLLASFVVVLPFSATPRMHKKQVREEGFSYSGTVPST